jgi:hypothetical protein
VAVGASSCGAPEGEWARIDGVERRLTFRKGGGAPSAAAGTEGQMPPSKLFVLARGSLPLGSLRRRFQARPFRPIGSHHLSHPPHTSLAAAGVRGARRL